MPDKHNLRPWKTLERRLVHDHGKFLKVENHVVELPDGQVITDWAWVNIPDAAIVLARTRAGKFICFRQTKYAVQGVTFAPVGGMIEPGEEPLAAAQRELLEETGFSSSTWKLLGSYVLDPNRGIAIMHLFLALDAEQTTQPIPDDLEDQELLLLSQAELQDALERCEFKVIAWAAAVALALNYIHSSTKSGEME